jgi:hypothetical protein
MTNAHAIRRVSQIDGWWLGYRASLEADEIEI